MTSPPECYRLCRAGSDLHDSRSGVDAFSMPTPPRNQDQSHFPTPESVRQPAKPVVKSQAEAAATTMMPTPQTLPRPPRKAVLPDSDLSAADAEISTPPSPSGHTTFYLSSSSASGSRGEKISRRRPGLTFAQQMGLLSTSHAGPAGSASRPGVGVGMGGSRSGGHKKDQVVWGHLADPVALQDRGDENPFLVMNHAPGRDTLHRPRAQLEDEDVMGSEPLKYQQPATDPLTGLLTPPPTRPERGLRTIPKSKRDPAADARRREQKAKMEKMMDVEANPFLVKPGESSQTSKTRRMSPIVDESKSTVTYVFRGAKKVFANPFYPSDAPFPQALLDTEDEDYEPHPNPKPRLLFPSPPPAPSKRQVDLGAFQSPPGASPPSSPTMATPRRRLFSSNEDRAQLAEEEEDEDAGLAETTPPTRRRLFAVAPPSAPAKRLADHHGDQAREEKKFKGMRV